MARKENKGGILTNEQIEEDLKASGKAESGYGYTGSQDNGDTDVTRFKKSDRQQQDKRSSGSKVGEE